MILSLLILSLLGNFVQALQRKTFSFDDFYPGQPAMNYYCPWARLLQAVIWFVTGFVFVLVFHHFAR